MGGLAPYYPAMAHLFENDERRQIVAHLALLVLLAGITLAPGSGTLPLMDRDEPRFARATIEMMRTGDWIVPHFNSEYRFDKPPLTYWLMSVGYRVFGFTEFGARAASILASLATAIALYAMGRRWFSPLAGLLAGFGWLTALQVLLHGRGAVADPPLVLCVTLAQWALFELLGEQAPSRAAGWRWTLWLSLAFGFLAKGPIALAVPFLGALLFRLYRRAPLPWRRLGALWGVPILLLVVGAWGIPALWLTRGAFWSGGMEKHVIDRGVRAWNSRLFLPLFYYPLTFFFSLFPWSAFAGRAIARVQAQRHPRAAFLAGWFLAPMLIFSFYATQLPHYTLPGFPAAVLLTAWALTDPPRDGVAVRVLFVTVIGFFLAAALALGVLVAIWPLPVLAPLRWAFGGAALLLAALVAIALCFALGRAQWSWAPLAAVALGFATLAQGLRAVHPAVLVRSEVARLAGDHRIAAYRFTEPSLVFYGDLGDRKWEMLDSPDALRAWAKEHGPRAVLVLEKEKKLADFIGRERQSRPARDFTSELEPLREAGFTPGREFEAFNSGRGTWVLLRWWTAAE